MYLKNPKMTKIRKKQTSIDYLNPKNATIFYSVNSVVLFRISKKSKKTNFSREDYLDNKSQVI